MTNYRNRIKALEYVNSADLAAHPGNWREHPAAQAEALKGVLAEVGIAGALLAYRSERQGGALVVIDGHLRKDAAPQKWPVLILDVDDAEADYLLAVVDPLAAMAVADAGALDALLSSVQSGEAGVQAMLAQLAEGAGLYGPQDDPQDADPQIDRAEELRQQWGVSPGQIWRLPSRTPGQEHRLICGDCTDAAVVERVMGGDVINIAFTSPPYAEQRDYDKSSGFKPIPPDEYVNWWNGVQSNVANHIAPDGSFFVNIKPHAEGLDTHLYVIDLVVAMVRRWSWHFATEFCWERNGVPKSVSQRFKNQFEPIYQFVRGRWKMRPEAVRHYSDSVPVARGEGVGNTSWANAQGGNGAMFGGAKRRKNQTSKTMSRSQGVPGGSTPGAFTSPGMAYPGNRLPTFASTHEATGHTAAFPVGLPEFFIKAYSDETDTVYEPFSGSGTTLIAAENLSRQCRACEISAPYVSVALQRYLDAFGIRAELVE